ncbi:hypothetical protein DVA86_27815 [Streptomyces armeniacus]|uniref:Uncharacterized protein n=1 Tax=Streptomyces armeniacus TaxID=83291 RepID=A0A345XW49_9ACTN|nr:hypothetical protein DVA86_27815 [Streptomyces armeniacus]
MLQMGQQRGCAACQFGQVCRVGGFVRAAVKSASCFLCGQERTALGMIRASASGASLDLRDVVLDCFFDELEVARMDRSAASRG